MASQERCDKCGAVLHGHEYRTRVYFSQKTQEEVTCKECFLQRLDSARPGSIDRCPGEDMDAIVSA